MDVQHTLMKLFWFCSLGSLVSEEEKSFRLLNHNTPDKRVGTWSHNAEATTNGPFQLRHKNKLVNEDTIVDRESYAFKSPKQLISKGPFISRHAVQGVFSSPFALQ